MSTRFCCGRRARRSCRVATIFRNAFFIQPPHHSMSFSSYSSLNLCISCVTTAVSHSSCLDSAPPALLLSRASAGPRGRLPPRGPFPASFPGSMCLEPDSTRLGPVARLPRGRPLLCVLPAVAALLCSAPALLGSCPRPAELRMHCCGQPAEPLQPRSASDLPRLLGSDPTTTFLNKFFSKTKLT